MKKQQKNYFPIFTVDSIKNFEVQILSDSFN